MFDDREVDVNHRDVLGSAGTERGPGAAKWVIGAAIVFGAIICGFYAVQSGSVQTAYNTAATTPPGTSAPAVVPMSADTPPERSGRTDSRPQRQAPEPPPSRP